MDSHILPVYDESVEKP